MSNFLDIEEKENPVPILCLFGNYDLISKQLIEENADKFRIIIVASKKPSYLDSYPTAYFISYDKIALLPKLSETISYAVVFVSEKNQDFLPPLIEKLKSDRARTLVTSSVLSLPVFQDVLPSFRTLATARFALMGEILTRKKMEGKGELSKIIENAITNGHMIANGEEIIPVYGATLRDAILGIHRLLFGTYKNDTVYNLFYKNPQTLLESAHLIVRVEPETKIVFNDSTTSHSLLPHQKLHEFITTTLRMKNSYIDAVFGGFEKGVVDLFSEDAEIEEAPQKIIKKKIARKTKGVLSPLKFAAISIVFGSFLFLFANLLFFGLGLLYLRNSISNLEKSNFDKAVADARISHFFLTSVKPTISVAFEMIELLDQQGNLQQTYSLLERGRELTEIGGLTIGSLFNNPQLNEKTLTSSIASLSYLYQEGQRLTIESPNKTLSDQLKETYSKLLSFSEVLPEIVGFGQEKNYLLLFQNNDELRPTGGFVGSIGELKIKNGKISKIAIQDVYELDGQLKNHIEPPFIVRRYLQPHLYLRDSNFYLNFQEAASTSAKIYNLETGNRPDGVVAVNLRVLQKILEITGPISLPNYNVTVDKNTVSQFLHNTIHENFFPGSTQKKDVLNSLFTQLVERGKNDQKFNVAIIKLLPDLLEEKDIMVSFHDTSIQKIFSANNYAGEYHDTRPQNAKRITDFLFINESNIGVNKVNAAVSREVYYKTMIGTGKLYSKASLVLTNNSPTDAYTNYLQVVVPRNSALRQITINGTKQTLTQAVTDPQVYEAKDFLKPDGLEVEQYNRGNYTYFAFIVIAKTGEKTTVDIEYDNGALKPLSTIIDYSLFYVKQSGTQPYKVVTTLEYPEGYVPVDTSASSYGTNFLDEETTATKDFEVKIQLQKRQ